jgi:hypothetical protein
MPITFLSKNSQVIRAHMPRDRIRPILTAAADRRRTENMVEPPTLFANVVAELAAQGVQLSARPGEYVVNVRDGTPATAYITDDLNDAIEHGRAWARSLARANPEPPLGPTGPRSQRRAMMYRHNKKLAARRAARRRRAK